LTNGSISLTKNLKQFLIKLKNIITAFNRSKFNFNPSSRHASRIWPYYGKTWEK